MRYGSYLLNCDSQMLLNVHEILWLVVPDTATLNV